MNNLLYDIYPILPEIFIILCVCILLIYGALYSISLGYPVLTKTLGLITLQTVLFSFLLSNFQQFQSIIVFNNFFICDLFTHNIKCFIILIFIGWFFTTIQYVLYEKINSYEYWILTLLALLSSLLIIQSYDLLSIYLSIELQSLLFYILASFKRTSEFSVEAGLKYFILGAFSSALLLFGISLIYGLTGLTNLGDLAKIFSDATISNYHFFNGVSGGLILILISLLFKLSAAPFHMWSPDVYEGSPTSITAFFSIVPKLAVLTLIYRILVFSFYDFLDTWYLIVLICVLLSILIGVFSAFSQAKWKRFLAYSSINHVGFFLLPLLLGNKDSIFGSIFYVCVYMITMLNVFSTIFCLRFYTYSQHHQTRYLENISGLSKTNPIISLFFTLTLFSMAGIPPLIGFFSKVFVLLPGLQMKALGVSIYAVIASCIACFYYIKLIKMMYFSDCSYWSILNPIGKSKSIILVLSFFFVSLSCYDIEFLSLFSTQISLAFTN